MPTTVLSCHVINLFKNNMHGSKVEETDEELLQLQIVREETGGNDKVHFL